MSARAKPIAPPTDAMTADLVRRGIIVPPRDMDAIERRLKLGNLEERN